MSQVEHEPTTDELLQDEQTDYPTIPVRVEGPAKVQTMPSVAGAMRSWTVDSNTAQKIAGEDPRRRRLVVYSADQPVYLGNTAQEATSGYGFLLRDHEPLVIEHTSQVWAVCAAANLTTIVSALAEQWAD